MKSDNISTFCFLVCFDVIPYTVSIETHIERLHTKCTYVSQRQTKSEAGNKCNGDRCMVADCHTYYMDIKRISFASC